MKHLLIALGLVFVAPLLSHAQIAAPSPLPAASEPERSSKTNERDEQTVDFFIPVITMEQVYSGPTRIQGYRIQIFRDGRGIYHGLKNVKTLGEERFNITGEQVQKILGDFNKYKFWDVPQDQYGAPKGEPRTFGIFTLKFDLRDGGKVKTVRFGAQDHALVLQEVVENVVRSAQWRCPYLDDRDIELCASLDRYKERAIPFFLKHDFPKLQETYK